MNFLNLFSSQLIFILIILIIIIGVIIFVNFKPNPKFIIKDIAKVLDDHQIKFHINDSTDGNYTFDLTIENTTYTVLVLPIENFAEITINNFNTWEMHYGAGDKPGKAQPFKVRIPEIPGFMSLDKENKIVLIHPNAKQIVYWKNENEIVEVLPNNKIYNVNVLNLSDLPKLFNK